MFYGIFCSLSLLLVYNAQALNERNPEKHLLDIYPNHQLKPGYGVLFFKF